MKAVSCLSFFCLHIAFSFQNRGILLEDLTWLEAEKILTKETVVVLPIGAASKEHGPHLKLKNDLILAEYFKKRVLESANVVNGADYPVSLLSCFCRISRIHNFAPGDSTGRHD